MCPQLPYTCVSLLAIANHADTAPSPEDLAIVQETTDQLRALIAAAIPHRRNQAIIFALYFEDMTAGETAERFGLSEKTIESIRTQALKVLRATPGLAALLRPTAT